jgi:ribA/ribD-fused uncharacterized protein
VSGTMTMVEGIRGFSGEYAFLSNFHLSPVTVGDGLVYPSGEHAFQAQKTPDRPTRERIARLATPGEAKGAGRHVALRSDWERIKKQVMLRVVLGKFCRNENDELARLLCATGRAPLVESNTWHDNYWGDCRCGRPSCSEPGKNYLGGILMAVRLVLRED